MEALVGGDTEIVPHDLRITMNKLTRIHKASKKTGYAREFKVTSNHQFVWLTYISNRRGCVSPILDELWADQKCGKSPSRVLDISSSSKLKLGRKRTNVVRPYYHRFRWYATLENRTPAETFPKIPSVLRVIDRSDRNPPITATSVTLWPSLRHASGLWLVDFDPTC